MAGMRSTLMLDLILQPPPTKRKSFFVSIFYGWGISASKELGCHLTFIAMVEMFRGLLGPAREEGMLTSGHRVLHVCHVACSRLVFLNIILLVLQTVRYTIILLIRIDNNIKTKQTYLCLSPTANIHHHHHHQFKTS